MPHATQSRPSTSDRDSGVSSSSTNYSHVFGNVKSRFREFGISNATNTILRPGSRSRRHGKSASNGSDDLGFGTSAASTQRVLPDINCDDFIPGLSDARKASRLRRQCVDLRVQIQMLEQRNVKICSLKVEIEQRLEDLAAAENAIPTIPERSERYDVWARKLSRRKDGDAQLFTNRVARRAPSPPASEPVSGPVSESALESTSGSSEPPEPSDSAAANVTITVTAASSVYSNDDAL